MADSDPTPDRCSLAFSKLADVALALGAAPLTKWPGPWECSLPGGWGAKINGHDKKIDGVPPYSAMLTFNGWPAGCINPAGGVIITGSENAFIAACEQELQRLAGAPPS